MPAPAPPGPAHTDGSSGRGGDGTPPSDPGEGAGSEPLPTPGCRPVPGSAPPRVPSGDPGRGLTASTPSSWEGVRTGKPDGGSFLPHGSQRDPGVLPARPNPGVPPGSREGPSALATSVCVPAPPAPAPSPAQPVPTSNPGGRN